MTHCMKISFRKLNLLDAWDFNSILANKRKQQARNVDCKYILASLSQNFMLFKNEQE